MDQDVKDVEFLKVQEDAKGIIYAIIFRQFTPIMIPEGSWQVKNIMEA